FMKPLTRASLVVAVSLALSSAAQPAAGGKASGKDVEGFWLGTLKVAGTELRLVATIAKKMDGSYTGTMDSPDQGAKGLPIDTVLFKDGELRLEMKGIKGSFVGKLSADGAEVAGKWTQAGETLPLTFKRVAKPPEARRPQEPKRPYPYLDEEVTYE